MSSNRDKVRDRAVTQKVIQAVRTGKGTFREFDESDCKNWLGHTLEPDESGSARIDEMLVQGVPWSLLQKARSKPKYVKDHCKHLIEDHGLVVVYPHGRAGADFICTFNI